MAPTRGRTVVKEQFPSYFKNLKTSSYTDLPPNRAHPPSHLIRTLSWNALGTLIATGAGDRTLRIWNPERVSSRYSTELRGHAGPVDKVEFRPTVENELASCGSDGTVRLWDVRKREAIAEVRIPGSSTVNLLSWTPDGEEIVVGFRGSNELYSLSRSDLNSPQLLPTPSDLSALQSIAFSNSLSNPLLLASSVTGHLEILQYPSLDKVYSLDPHTAPFLTQVSPAGNYLATGGVDARITLWDTSDFICARTLDRCTGPITSFSFTFDGSYILGGSDETAGLDIAHVETGEYVYSIDTHGPSACVAWHPNRYALAYTGDGGMRIVGGIIGG